MDWNNLGGPLRGEWGGVGGDVVTGNDRDKVWRGKKKKKKNTLILLFIIIKYVMFISHAAKKILKMSIQASITLN